MTNKAAIGIVVAVLIVAGGYYFLRSGTNIGQAPSDTPGVPLLVEENAVIVSSQRPGMSVMGTVVLAAPGYLVIHEDNAGRPGAIMGASALLQAGESSNVEVALSRSTEDGETLYAMLHADADGNGAFGASLDTPIESRIGGPIHGVFKISEDASADVPISTHQQGGQPSTELPKTASPRQNKTGQIIGAIRWDAWHDGQVGREVEKVLGPKKWRDRLPFFGQEISNAKVLVRADTQKVMDQEIAYARAAGLDYWAFLSYEPMTASDMSKSFRLYLSSSKKRDVNFALILHASGLPSKAEWPALVQKYVGYFKDPVYQKIVGGRPLFFIFPVDSFVHWAGSELEAHNALAELRDAAVAAGLPSPYFAAMVWDANEGAAYVDKLGLQAISAYATVSGSKNEEKPYSDLAHANQNFWEASKNTGKKVIPIVSVGWDPRPRWEIPVSWAPNPIPGTYYADATPDELADNLKKAMDWNAANSTAAEAKAVIIYAWNEIDEGGWLLPSNTAFNSVGAGRLDAIGTMIRNWTPPL